MSEIIALALAGWLIASILAGLTLGTVIRRADHCATLDEDAG